MSRILSGGINLDRQIDISVRLTMIIGTRSLHNIKINKFLWAHNPQVQGYEKLQLCSIEVVSEWEHVMFLKKLMARMKQ